MTKLRRTMLELFVLALLVMSSAISLGQLNATAAAFACTELTCVEQEDCGPDATKCFCNRPSQKCFKPDAEEIEQ
jgi:hypothetical protein